MMEVIVDIYELTGTTTNSTFEKVASDVRVVITPSNNEDVALYESMAQGQLFSFYITGDVVGVKPQSKLKITNRQAIRSLNNGDEFITITNTKHNLIGGRDLLTGICYKVA